MAAKQRQAEIAAEEREKREREEALKARLEDKPGKFIPPSLRRKLETGDGVSRDSTDTWNDRRDVRPHVEERRPLFGGRGLAPRETDRHVEGEAEIPPSNRYQHPRARISDPDAPAPRPYEPPRGGARGDSYPPSSARGDEPARGAYEPRRVGAREDSYAHPGRLGSRPLGQRPVIGGGRAAEDRPERQDRW